ncbi:hypothetical protein RM704_15670 [Streptomyces sp. DSM 3412]|uniref:Heme exporter protein D n=1 Tax=Streptomyces gottesmaniae TaxID=3075518 RepID=A0ABU2YXD8_9ACTN|nr:hypothetical protein [Streptomyces sp. DSM 3412]MDT0568891.1 hypothetical protein [Streptomyces sp. DSM 3412]
MTENELQILCAGFTLGAYFMVLVQVGFGIRDDRRDRKAARAAMAQLEAARAKVKA